MIKKWPDGPVSGPVSLAPLSADGVRVSLAAAADSLGTMVWIAAWQGADGSAVRGDRIVVQGTAPSAAPGDCERGGFGWTGGQFYKPEEES